MDTNKLKEKRAELNKELSAIVERNASGVMSKEDSDRFDHLEKESAAIKSTIERSERVASEARELGSFKAIVEPKLDLSKKDREAYSIVRAIRNRLDGKPLDGLEGEVSREIERQTGTTARGFYMPTKELSWGVNRAFDVANTGSSLVTQSWNDYIDALRNASILGQVGATYLTGLNGLVNVPVKSATTTAYWVAEAGAPTGSAPTVTSAKQLSPKCVGAYSDLTRSLVAQSSYDVEMMVRNDLLETVSKAIDSAAVNGTGSSNQPTGLIAAVNSATSLGTNGAALMRPRRNALTLWTSSRFRNSTSTRPKPTLWGARGSTKKKIPPREL